MFFSQEELKKILGDISFLKSKRNVANLFSTLKTQLNYHMSETFKQIIEEENLSELFTNKNTLLEEDAKYVFTIKLNIIYFKLFLFLENILLMMTL